MRRLLLPALLLVLAGCGSSSDQLAPHTREQLLGHVEAVKAAASAYDRPAAEAALGDLHRAIAEAQARGELDTDAARTLLAATERIAEDVRAMPRPQPPPPVTVTVTPEPPVVEQPPDHSDEPRGDRAEERAKRWQEQLERWERDRELWRKVRENSGNNGNGNGNGNENGDG